MKRSARPKRTRRFGPPRGGGRAGGGKGSGGGSGEGSSAASESFSWWGYIALMVLVLPTAFIAITFVSVVVKVVYLLITGHG